MEAKCSWRSILGFFTAFFIFDPGILMAHCTPSDMVNSQKLSQRRQYRDGDILIGAAIPVTQPDSEGGCSEIIEPAAMFYVETMNMIIDRVNKNESILPGVKLGSIMVDTCSSSSHAIKQVIQKILPLALGVRECRYNCTGPHRKPILAGVIGAQSSSISIPMTKILQVFEITQISYWSTSTELNDRNRFKYFFRTVPPDTYQAKAIITLIKKMNWNYVSLVHNDDAYGRSGHAELFRQAELSNVCIAYDMALPMEPELENLTHIVQELMEVEKAKAVIVFTSERNARRLISAAQNVPGASDSLIWIGTDGWGHTLEGDDADIPYWDSLDGAIALVPKITLLEGILDYTMNVTLGNNNNIGENYSRNPWFAPYISQATNCSLKDSPPPRCSPDATLDRSHLPYNDNTFANAVLAYVYALHAYHEDVCGGKPGLCENITRNAGTNKAASDLYKYLKNVSFVGGGGRRFEFDENQDGPPIYDVVLYTKPGSGFSHTNQSSWSRRGTFQNDDIILDGGKEGTKDLKMHPKIWNTSSVCSEPCNVGQARYYKPEVCCWQCGDCPKKEYVDANESCKACPSKQIPNPYRNACVAMDERELSFDSIHSVLPLVLGTFGFISTVAVSCIYFKFSNTAIVRASGKELCFFVLFGIFVTLINCFTVIGSPSQFTCIASGLILALGPACMYSGLLMKTARVVFIFQSKGILSTRIKVYLQPIPLILVTTSVALIQVFIMGIWFHLDFPEPGYRQVDDDILFRCCMNLIDIKILVGLVYPFILIISCTVLTTINRNVPTGFKETLYVGFTMYITLIIWLTFLPIFLTNSTDIPKKLITVSVALTVSAITVLYCLFVPRCYSILFKPETNTAERVMSLRKSRPGSIRSDGKRQSQSIRGGRSANSAPDRVDPRETDVGYQSEIERSDYVKHRKLERRNEDPQTMP